MTPHRRAHSIALRIFALTFIAVLLTAIVLFAVTFRGPPPRPAPVRLEVVAEALRTGRAPKSGEQQMRLSEDDALPTLPRQARADEGARSRLAQLLRRPVVDIRVQTFEPQQDPFMLRGSFAASVRVDRGWRTMASQPPQFLTRWHLWTLQAMALACLVLGAVAWLIARQITRPLADLAAAASGGGLGHAIDLPPGGPREVRALGDALSAMHARLAGHAENRTAMFAAIAHDLGTPLSRIAFWIEQLPEPARIRAAADVEEMRAMLGDVLRFARDERLTATARIDLGSVLDALADDLAAAGRPVSLTPGERAIVRGDAGAIRRLFANLVDNAIRYGGDAQIGWRTGGGEVTVTIDDGGPGFGTDRNRLFEPFVRGDPSRNRATGGTGLGLAIVRSLTEAHGGRVELGNGPAGGRVTVTLPLA